MLLVADIDCVDALTALSCSSLAVDLGSLSGAFSPTLSALRKKCTIVYPNAVRPLKQATQCSAFRLPAEAFSCAWLWHFWMRLWGSGKNVQLGVTLCTPDQCLWGAPTWAWLRDGCLVGCWGGPFPRGGGGGGAQCCSQRAPASFAELAGGGGGPWKQGRDETYGVLFTVPWRLRCNRSFNSTSFYILLPKNIHSYMLKWSLEPPKSHGETSSFCSACSAQIRADRCVCT